VLVAMLGLAVAEGSGLIGAGLRLLVLSAPRRALTFAVVFAGIMSNTGGEVGYVLLIPLAAMMFHAVGRHPLAGLAAAFAGVSGGYSANLLLGTVDPLLAGLSEEAARIIDPGVPRQPSCNYYFMAASTFLIATLGTWSPSASSSRGSASTRAPPRTARSRPAVAAESAGDCGSRRGGRGVRRGRAARGTVPGPGSCATRRPATCCARRS
jgi:hypothetical protein